MRLPVLLLALAALLSWGAARLHGVGVPDLEVVEATRAAPVGPLHTPQQTSTPSAVDIPPAPPLFRAAQAVSTTPQPGERLLLIGLAGAAGARIALLRDEADGRTFSARAGDEIRNWTLEEISERCVTLRRTRQRESACIS